MDHNLKEQLVASTRKAIAVDDWLTVESLWAPYVEAEDVEAEFQVAFHFLFCGFDGEQDRGQEMRALLEKAANGGHAEAMYWFALKLPSQEEEKRYLLLQEAAHNGSPSAQRHLGALYATGDLTGCKDLPAAIHWYGLASERGHAEAQYNLGFMHLLGEGTPQNIPEALQLLHTSADQGNEEAESLLAHIYRTGYCGGPIDHEKAAELEQRLLVRSRTRE